MIQLCARVGADGLADLRHRLPGIKLVQVVHVTGAEAVDRACVVDALVDAVLLDSGRPHADRPELGGTGKVHDWSLSARIRDRLSSRVLLAGGLTEHNVQEAIRTVRPFGVDVCSGVRTDGGLDAGKLERFVRRVRASQAW